MTQISTTINGTAITADVADNRLLVDFIREDRGLTGTHIGCDTSQCGACVIHCDGVSVKACTMLAVQADGADLTTIEGIGTADSLHPMQRAFCEHHGLQCGFCTPGMIMSAIEFVQEANGDSGNFGGNFGAESGAESIREALEGNICRCTGYQNIVTAVAAAAKAMAE